MHKEINPRSRLGASQRSSKPSLRIVYCRIEELKPDPANARVHSKKQIRQIANSIETFGFNVPILVDADLNVICRPVRDRIRGRYRR
jgi:ParB-like nuclease domain